MHVLDTDACVDLLRHPLAGSPRVQRLEEGGEVVTTAMTVQELVEGARRAKDPSGELRRVQTFLAALRVLPHDRETAELAGSIAADLGARGAPIGDADTIIAAIALHHGARLVTRNMRHFRNVEGLALSAF